LSTLSEHFMSAKTAVTSIVSDKRLVAYGLLLLVLHLMGVLFLYDAVAEYDNAPHLWFGYVLSECSSKAARSVNLQSRLASGFRDSSGTTISLQQADFVVRLLGYLLIGGLFWEGAEIAFSRHLGFRPDSFFAFPITLRNIDGALDVSVGVLGAAVAFIIANRKPVHSRNIAHSSIAAALAPVLAFV